jgi:4-amino-4-deoxy-L-arabinose transferase-like glycosyltransferase
MGVRARFPFLYSPACMVLVGLMARLLYLVIGHEYRFTIFHWRQFEMANLAYSLATDHGFGSPFGGDTGPSAWTAPLYPWMMSLAFRAFGVFSDRAAFAILAFNSIFSALTSWTIYRIARRVLDETVAVWSGWIWALLPYAMYWAVTWVWETSLSAFLLSALFLLTLEMEGDDRLRSWFGYGLLWGICGLINTSMLSWLPFSGCWLAYQLHRRGKRFLAPAAFGALLFWATLTPWLVRNYSVFGKPLLIRGDLGVELRAGNNPQAEGWWVPNYLPHNNSYLYAQYKEMGEPAYDAEQFRLVKEWVAQDPGRFVVLCFRRFLFYWAGIPREGVGLVVNLLFAGSSLLALGGLLLAAKRRVHGVFLFATLLAAYPVIYYFTFPTARYRHPVEPELLTLGVFLLWSLPALLKPRRHPVG